MNDDTINRRASCVDSLLSLDARRYSDIDRAINLVVALEESPEMQATLTHTHTFSRETCES